MRTTSPSVSPGIKKIIFEQHTERMPFLYTTRIHFEQSIAKKDLVLNSEKVN